MERTFLNCLLPNRRDTCRGMAAEVSYREERDSPNSSDICNLNKWSEIIKGICNVAIWESCEPALAQIRIGNPYDGLEEITEALDHLKSLDERDEDYCKRMEAFEPVCECDIENEFIEKTISPHYFPGCIPDYGEYRYESDKGDKRNSPFRHKARKSE